MNKIKLFLLLLLPVSASAVMIDLGTSMPIDPTFYGTNTLTFSGNTIDADGEKFYFIGQIPKTGPIRRIAYKTVTVTVGSNLVASIETVVNGLPSGTSYCTDSSTTATTVNTDDNVWKESQNFNTDCAATQGDFVAIGLTRAAGSSFNGQVSDISLPSSGDFGYEVSSTGVTGFVKAVGIANFAFVYADGSYGFNYSFSDALAYTAQSWNSGTNPLIRGNLFTPSFTFSFSRVGTFMSLLSPAVLEVWDQDQKTVMTSVVLSTTTDVDASTGSMFYTLPKTVTWYANKSYRITVRPTTATNMNATIITFANAAMENAAPMGTRIQYTATNVNPPTGPGDWTQTALQRSILTPMISAVEYKPGGGYGVAQ